MTEKPTVGGKSAGESRDRDHAADVASQLRRRRLAAQRCPPLASGLRDPIDGIAEPPPFRGGVLVDDGVGQYAFLRCKRTFAAEIFDLLGLPALPTWSSTGAGFPVRRSSVGDVIAAADYLQIRLSSTTTRRRG